MRLIIALLAIATTVAYAAQFHVRVRVGDADPLMSVHDADVDELAADDSHRVFLFEAPSEDALRGRLLWAGMQARRSDGQLIIARVRDVTSDAVPGSWGQDRIDQRALPLNNNYAPVGTGTGVTAWVVDTGVDASHADFGGRASNDFATYSPAYDCDGHGTHVASTLGGTQYGVAPGVRIRAVKVLNCDGAGTTFTVAQGLQYILAHLTGRDVINLSLGYGSRDSVVESLLDDLVAEGAFVAASAGNSNSNACSHFPSSQAGVRAVASSTRSDSRSSFSNYGSCVDIFAPGSDIRAARMGGGSRELSGTSMSSPHVAAAGAIYLQSNPAASSAQVWDHVRSVSTTNAISGASGSPNRLVFVGNPTAPQPTTSSGSTSSSSTGTSTGTPPSNGATGLTACLLLGVVALLAVL